jgi:hypothetical protein
VIDFWLAFILTTAVSILTVAVDWLASKLILGARALRSIQATVNAGLPTEETQQRLREDLQRYNAAQTSYLLWGSDLATVAVSMDFAALGIWIHNSLMFPFFSRFNTDEASREIPVWLIVMFSHFILLAASLVLRHFHVEAVAKILVKPKDQSRVKQWVAQNWSMISANALGFLALLSGMVVLTNAW